ncbi:serine hydrolase [Oculatella sp. LEGE 06141]|uniref:serine hydrolase n=1 Tax=Oculatella sp. LEGE 06141 TaxID=1828648 RepID=UPI00187F31B8|nr:serine hydrolase [Oculatella sp. LEGE 06141]MBE9178417.1 serine hydrolase [Oculatella sp. LEGE 06141]
MLRFLYWLVAPVGAIGVLVGLAALRPPLAHTPVIETIGAALPEPPESESLQQLYQMRDRLHDQMKESSGTLVAAASNTFSFPNPLQLLQALEIRILIEETAQENWNKAMRSAVEADLLDRKANPSLGAAKASYTAWKQAVQFLQEVPDKSLLGEQAAQKLQEYRPRLAAAAYKYDTARSGYLKPIAEKTGLPLSQVKLTVCHSSGECRRLNGNQKLASPASLIKMPVAIAFMDKAIAKNINLNTKIVVSPDNYTEDASDVWIGSEYSLRHILIRMINQSSNIATNQLIDYVGKDYINQVMRQRGYKVTLIDMKLVGEAIQPANLGSIPNETTTDELTEMMRQIYTHQHPGDEVLMEALSSQYDTVLGYEGLKPTKAIWLGEKTGQNSDVLGTTLAFRVNEETYVMSVALDFSGNEFAVRQVIRDVANHIANQGL